MKFLTGGFARRFLFFPFLFPIRRKCRRLISQVTARSEREIRTRVYRTRRCFALMRLRGGVPAGLNYECRHCRRHRPPGTSFARMEDFSDAVRQVFALNAPLKPLSARVCMANAPSDLYPSYVPVRRVVIIVVPWIPTCRPIKMAKRRAFNDARRVMVSRFTVSRGSSPRVRNNPPFYARYFVPRTPTP